MKDLWPFAIQGFFLGVDEFICHHRRGLGRWERLGHPVDTLSFVIALGWIYHQTPTRANAIVYIILAAASCVMVTKDEWEHRERCGGFENWLHAWLFMLHPSTLIWAGYLWWSKQNTFSAAVGGSLALALAFAGYQIIYWNWWRPRRDQQ